MIIEQQLTIQILIFCLAATSSRMADTEATVSTNSSKYSATSALYLSGFIISHHKFVGFPYFAFYVRPR